MGALQLPRSGIVGPGNEIRVRLNGQIDRLTAALWRKLFRPRRWVIVATVAAWPAVASVILLQDVLSCATCGRGVW